MDMETAAENVEEAAKDVNRLVEYVNSQSPNIINFGLKVVLSLICFFIGRKLIRWVQKLVRASLNRANVDKGVEQFVDSMLKVVLYCILIFSLVANFGVDTTSIAALFASGGVAIGLALQGSLSNFAGGVLILLLKPFVVGDYIIESGTGNEGTVKEIQIFYTKLSTVDNRMIVIPNGALSNNSLTNVTAKEKRRLEIKVGISYESDLRKAKEVIESLLLEDESILKDEEIIVYVDELAESSVVIGSKSWVKTDDYWPTRWRLLEEIKLTMDEQGINIPYPQMDVHIQKES